MIGRAHTAGVFGIDGYIVDVEAVIGPGLPGLTIVGQLDGTSLRRSSLRVSAALDGCGVLLPRRKQIVNLAPAERRKDGSGVDLAIACALLVCHGVIPAASLSNVLLWGELAPDGTLLPAVGTLIIAEAARQRGFRVLALASSSVGEAAPVVGIEVLPVSDLSQLIAHFRGETIIPCGRARFLECAESISDSALGLAAVSDPLARLALEVMIAGGHHLLVYGPHGSGKSKLVQAVAVRTRTSLVCVPQVRMPTPSVPVVDLLGGGAPPRPGEISLAHHGVLVLNGLTEFSRPCLDGLRIPLEDGAVTVGSARFPSWFRLLATLRSCPCGWFGHPDRACMCKPAAIRRFFAQIPAALIDRVDLVVCLTESPHTTMPHPREKVRRRIAVARCRQRGRLVGMPWRSNAEIPASGVVLEQLLPVTPAAERLLTALGHGGLDQRALRRMCRVARTIADLDPERDPAAPIDPDDIVLASQLRKLPCAR